MQGVCCVDFEIVGGRVCEDNVDDCVVLSCQNDKSGSIAVGPSLHNVFGLECVGGNDGCGTPVSAEGIEVNECAIGGGNVDAFVQNGVGLSCVDVMRREG